jgi:DNA invertase Pin-like site-specific DNA recombinase
VSETSRIYGYARVSTEDQNLDMQINALKAAGCTHILEEKKSGSNVQRRQYELLKKSIRPGDVLVVWKLDRLGRSIKELVTFAETMQERGIEFRSITEGIDTTKPMGKFMFHLLASLAQLERDIISERTKAGVAAAKARGVHFGQPSKIVGEKRDAILKDIWALELTMDQIAEKYGLKSKTTLNNHFPGERAKALEAAGIRNRPENGRKK